MSNCSIDDANVPDEQVFAEFWWLKRNLERDEDLDEKSRNIVMFVCKILYVSIKKLYNTKKRKMKNEISKIFVDNSCRGYSSFWEYQITSNIYCFLEKLQNCEGGNFKRDKSSSYSFVTSNGVLKFSVGLCDWNGSSYVRKIWYNFDCISWSEFVKYQKILDILSEFKNFLMFNVQR